MGLFPKPVRHALGEDPAAWWASPNRLTAVALIAALVASHSDAMTGFVAALGRFHLPPLGHPLRVLSFEGPSRPLA